MLFEWVKANGTVLILKSMRIIPRWLGMVFGVWTQGTHVGLPTLPLTHWLKLPNLCECQGLHLWSHANHTLLSGLNKICGIKTVLLVWKLNGQVTIAEKIVCPEVFRQTTF